MCEVGYPRGGVGFHGLVGCKPLVHAFAVTSLAPFWGLVGVGFTMFACHRGAGDESSVEPSWLR
jgi:hypothetical protein